MSQAPRRSRSARSRGRKVARAVTIALASAAAVAAIVTAAPILIFGPDMPKLFRGRVAAIEKRLLTPPPQGVVLLTGSSYFQLWTTSAEDLAGLGTLNVGIGGTKIGDQIAFVDRLVFPVNPRALVVYAGSNDINGMPIFSKPAAVVVPRIKEYVGLVHARFPGLPVYYVAITEAPSRANVRGEIQQANRLLGEWATQSGEIVFIDTAPALLTPDGSIDGALFGPDRLHLNTAGYAKFAAAIREVLVRDLADERA